MPDAGTLRLFALDVDGVLTDNGLYLGSVGDQRVELKRFDIQDGLGLALLRGTGIELTLVSARPSEATALRAAELGLSHVLQVPDGRKIPALQGMLDELGIDWAEVAFLGDDLADIPVLKKVGLPMAVENAIPEVKALARYVTRARGGHGAVREAIEHLLRERGEYPAAVSRYLADREAMP